MVKEIILTPEELYYMGSTLQAKYIDYAYVAAMSDIRHNYALFEKETRASLVASGVLMEDFSGNVEIDEGVMALLNPIFFGETETSIDVCNIGESTSVDVYKLHFYDGIVTMVTGDSGKLLIKNVDGIGMKKLCEDLVPEGYDAAGGEVEQINKELITRFIAVKSVVVGQRSVVKTYIEADGVIYRETDGRIEGLTKEAFVSDVYDVIKGV